LASPDTSSLDLKRTLSKNRLLGLWRMMTGFRLVYVAATICVGIAAMSRTGTFLLLRTLVDDVLAKTRFEVLPLVALGFIGLAAIEGTFTFLGGRWAAQTSEGITRRLRNYLFDHIQRLSFTYHDHTPTGELIQRSTSDVDAVRRFFADQAINSWRIVLLFVINFAGLMSLSRQLALMSVAVVPFIIVVSIWFFKRISAIYEKNQEQEATLSTTLQENLTGVRVVRAFARQEFEQGKFERDNWEKFLRGRRLLTWHSFFWPVTDVFCGLQMVTGLYIAAVMVINGSLTLGDYLAYVGMIGMIIWPIRNLGRLVVQMSSGLVSYGRVTEVIKQDREPLTEGAHQPSRPLRGEVVFRDVHFQYEADAPVLKNISFECKPGQAIALLGSTGSGKTTLVNLLPRFYEYTGGSLTLDGVELNQYPRHTLRRQIGIVEQEPFLFSRTIRENITYGVGRGISEEEIVAAARAAAIHDVIVGFPNGYDTLVGEKGVTLSGGQKQRVAIARTLLKDPRILILDDSTSSVDMETEEAIRGALERLMQGRTTFIIAHRIQSLMNADLILVMDKGRIVQYGTHDELIEQPGTYRQIYDIQTRIETELEQEIANVGATLAVAQR
jgi:ATP-binding cassette subfamily B protein